MPSSHTWGKISNVLKKSLIIPVAGVMYSGCISPMTSDSLPEKPKAYIQFQEMRSEIQGLEALALSSNPSSKTPSIESTIINKKENLDNFEALNKETISRYSLLENDSRDRNARDVYLLVGSALLGLLLISGADYARDISKYKRRSERAISL